MMCLLLSIGVAYHSVDTRHHFTASQNLEYILSSGGLTVTSDHGAGSTDDNKHIE